MASRVPGCLHLSGRWRPVNIHILALGIAIAHLELGTVLAHDVHVGIGRQLICQPVTDANITWTRKVWENMAARFSTGNAGYLNMTCYNEHGKGLVKKRDAYPIDEWEKALEFKQRACCAYAGTGLSSVTKKYLKKSQGTPPVLSGAVTTACCRATQWHGPPTHG